ncbi:MAG: hypothetical protein LBT05_04705 [Planctomycetaceae bacterium]|jgi:hypothetical protein|nr:hypothetical protein [Planctomycetaceae bacterium]
MDSKFTRRAVLGTIIGGLTVTPFIVRYVKSKNRNTELTSDYSIYCDEWNNCLKKVYYSEKKINNLKEFQISPEILPNKEYQVLALTAQFGSKQCEISKETIPDWFDFIVGSAKQYKNISDQMILRGINYKNFYPGNVHEKKCGTRTVIKNDKGFTLDNNTGEKFDASCFSLFPALYYDYPQSEKLFLEKQWDIPKGSIYSFPTKNKIVGFFEVAGCKTFKIHVTGKNTSQSNQECYGMFTSTVDSSGKEKIIDVTKQCEFISRLDAMVYVELTTGLVVRHEAMLATETKWRNKINSNTYSSNDQFVYTINQRLEI